jgi:hypothetical protein
VIIKARKYFNPNLFIATPSESVMPSMARDSILESPSSERSELIDCQDAPKV